MKLFNQLFRKGFSLIELSIVLIIIGLLMAAVMKGKDLIRSTEMKKFYNTFIKAWELVYTQYYDRTGTPLGGPLYTRRTLVTWNCRKERDSANKTMTVCNPSYTIIKEKIKDFVGADIAIKIGRGDYVDLIFRKGDTIENRAKEAGLELPNTGRDKTYVYKVSFTDVSPVDVWITFGSDPVRYNEYLNICIEDKCDDFLPIGWYGKGDNRGNFMLIVNVPYDVAAQIDRIIDGYADGKKGDIICVGSYKDPIDPNKFKDINIIDVNNVKDYGNSANCGGSFNLGNKTKPYVTLMYKLGI